MKVLAILFAILACNEVTSALRILGVFPLQGPSHWVMMEPLMKGLAKRGHQVDVVTHFPQKKPIQNYKDISLQGLMPAVKNNVSATDVKRWHFISLQHLTTIGGSDVCKLLKSPQLQNLIKNPPKDPPYDVVITEVFMAPCFLAFGRHLKVPMVGMISSTFHDWLNDMSGNPIDTTTRSIFLPKKSMNFKNRLLNLLYINWITWNFHYHTSRQIEFVKEYFDMHDATIMDLYKDVSLYLVNSHHSIHDIRPMMPSVVEVGGLHIKDDDIPLAPEVQKWLDESKDGCVYFTLGSMVKLESFPKESLEQFYASFRKIAPVRVLMKIAVKEELPPGLPKNVMTQPWFPQNSVLRHKNIRAFITHGGLMGTLEAIYYGVPMIGIPLFGDQISNIDNYVQKKLAISLGSIYDVTEEKLSSALNNILNDPEYRENMQEVSKLFHARPMTALDTSIYWVEYVAKYGNILQSPTLQLTWYQRRLLDVYAFLILVVVVLLAIVFFVLCKLKKLVFGSRACKKKDNETTKLKKNK